MSTAAPAPTPMADFNKGHHHNILNGRIEEYGREHKNYLHVCRRNVASPPHKPASTLITNAPTFVVVALIYSPLRNHCHDEGADDEGDIEDTIVVNGIDDNRQHRPQADCDEKTTAWIQLA